MEQLRPPTQGLDGIEVLIARILGHRLLVTYTSDVHMALGTEDLMGIQSTLESRCVKKWSSIQRLTRL